MRSRFDREYPSISNLFPLTGAGPEQVVYTAMSDETAYISTGAIGENGFLTLRETLNNTDSPRRLKPFNINYHAYAGEYPALLETVKRQLQQARSTALAPISANRFAAIVDGFFSTRIDRLGNATWRISNRGALQTVRFDAADGREVDLQSSIGVIGQRRVGRTIYVALDAAIEPAVVVLSQHALSHTSREGLALVESRWLIRDAVNDGCALTFEAQGYGDGAFSWSGAAFSQYVITVDREGREVWRQTAQADDAARLNFSLPVNAIEPVMVRISCASVDRLTKP
jgi:hypothetical protein